MNLAKMAYNKLKAVEEDKKCLHCGKMAKEGCDCPNEAPEGMEEDDMDEEGPQHEAGESPEYESGEMEEEGEDSGIGRGGKMGGITINVNVGRK